MISGEDLDAMGYSYYNEIPSLTVEDMVRKLRKDSGSELHPKLLREELEHYVRAWREAKTNAEELQAVAFIVWTAYELAVAKGYDLRTALERTYMYDMSVYGLKEWNTEYNVDDLVKDANDE